MRKIGKKLKTASLNSRFTGSKKEQWTQERFMWLKKLWYGKSCSLFLHWFKNMIKFCRSLSHYYPLRVLQA